MTDDLVQFLRAQFAQEEAHAQKDVWAAENATRGRWRAHYGVNLDHSWVKIDSTPIVRFDAAGHEADVLLVARFQPETVLKRAKVKLAEVEAKRQIVKLHAIVHRDIGWLEDGEEEAGEIPVCGHCVRKNAHYPRREDVPEGPCTTLRLLALPYADGPDYREEWKP